MTSLVESVKRPYPVTAQMLYGFLIVLPVLVVHEESQIRRLFLAYLFVWISAYIVFIAYPTVAPRPNSVAGASSWRGSPH